MFKRYRIELIFNGTAFVAVKIERALCETD